MSIGEKIKQLRKGLGLTQTELGDRLGVKKNAVSKWECGRVEDIPTSTIKALANLFNVPPSYLIDDDSPFSIAKQALHNFVDEITDEEAVRALRVLKAALEEDQKEV